MLIDCSYKHLNDVLFLQFLNQQTNNDLSLITQLYCSDNRITIIPETLTNIKLLDCHNNYLCNIPNTLTNLEYLNCTGCHLTKLPNNLTSLTHLYCGHNNLTILPENLNNIGVLYCHCNKLVKLPRDLINLKLLNCCDNYLITIPDTLINITELFLNNKLVRVPYLKNIKNLYKQRTNYTFAYKKFIKEIDKFVLLFYSTIKKRLNLNQDIIITLFKIYLIPDGACDLLGCIFNY